MKAEKQTTAIQVYDFRGHRVRTAGTSDAPLFCAADVCDVLDLGNPSKACTDHVEPEDQDLILESASKTVDLTTEPSADTRRKRRLYVTEAGLYALIMGSRTQASREFKRWVTHEVLPEIRKTGAYDLVHRSERERLVAACFKELPEHTQTLFDPLIEALRKFLRSSPGTPPWARMIAGWVYSWTFGPHKEELRKRNPKQDDGSLVRRDYDSLNEEGRGVIQRNANARRGAWQVSTLLGCSPLYAEVSSARLASHLRNEIESLLASKWERLPRAEEEGRSRELFRRAGREDGYRNGYRDGYARRSDEFTKVIDAGKDGTVWLTPKPEHDVLRVAPPQKLPYSLAWDSRLRLESIPVLTFRPRVIAECYDGVQYRQVLWERWR